MYPVAIKKSYDLVPANPSNVDLVTRWNGVMQLSKKCLRHDDVIINLSFVTLMAAQLLLFKKGLPFCSDDS